MDSILVGIGYAPKVADFDHKELDIAPIEGYPNHKLDSSPTKMGFDQGKVDIDLPPLRTIRWIKILYDICIIRFLLQLLTLVVK